MLHESMNRLVKVDNFLDKFGCEDKHNNLPRKNRDEINVLIGIIYIVFGGFVLSVGCIFILPFGCA